MLKKARPSAFFLLAVISLGTSLYLHQGSASFASNAPESENSSRSISRQSLLSQFSDPPSNYGPIDCWWWEAGHLSKEKMTWQVEELKRKGVTGSWLYPRFPHGDPLSSDPRYWTEEWWNFTRFALEEHRRLGLKLWISDWTSHQFFQNRVRQEREKDPRLMGRRLVIHEKESESGNSIQMEFSPQEEVLEAAAFRKTGDRLEFSTRVVLNEAIREHKLLWQAPEAGWLVTVVTSQANDLNYLDQAVVRRWLELFLEQYKQKLTEFVGNTLAAYGPDEMWVLMGNILYSPAIIEKVKSEKGYDLSPYLTGLFYDIGAKTDQVRCDYYGAMTSLLEENFYKPISQWLVEHGMQYVTIATWGREDLLEQTFHYGDFFRFMRWFHVTGNEDPYRTESGERKFVDAKLSSSIAHLNQRQRAAMCVYWGSGWGMALEENLAWTHENFAYGLNLYNQHGGQYTLMGGWYEWVPPSVDFYQPYWQYWKTFSDYIRRLSFIMSQGQHRADVALLYPLSTIHANWIGGRVSGSLHREAVLPNFTSTAMQSAETTLELAKRIYRSGIDLDFVDESSLEHAQVNGQTLQISGLEFRAVLMPPLTTIRAKTLQKVKEFYDNGGTLVAFGNLPNASAERGRGDPEVQKLLHEIFGPLPAPPAPGDRVVVARQNPRHGNAFFIPDNSERVGEILSQAIVPDVVASEEGVFHTHQKVGNLDVYFLFNVRAERRKLTVRFRVNGEPEIWDAYTGKAQPHYDFQRNGQTTRVGLEMEPYQGVVLVLTPAAGRAEVLEHNLSSLVKVEAKSGGVIIEGFDEKGGKKRVRVTHQGREYVAEREVAASPRALNLEGPFRFHLEPTMDNRWGDFRYPASPEKIGAEARRFKYREEEQMSGTELGWQTAGFDDSDWPEVTYSYGPYWWQLGPVEQGKEPPDLVERAKRGEVDVAQRFPVGETRLQWQPYSFSQKFGSQEHEIHSDFRQGSLLGVSENFLVFEAADDIQTAVHYLSTTVTAPREGDYTLHFGGKPEKSDYDKSRHALVFQVPSRRQVWVNGEEVLKVGQGQMEEVQKRVHFKRGHNSVLLKIVHPGSQKVATYAVFQESAVPPADPYTPLLRWFLKPQNLICDLTPQKATRVGWYRFKAPPGLQSFRFTARARGIQAWINGVPTTAQENRVALASSLNEVSQVALRVEQEPGTYAGAVFLEPIAFECKEGQIPLGDWTEFGLKTYSGAAVYSSRVQVQASELVGGKVLLDLGNVKTVAELQVNGKPAGIKMSRPFRFDISELVKEGVNEVRIKVANTLANHMSSYPTKFVYRGQTVSGLLGPVQLQFLSKVTLTGRPSKSP